MSLGHRLTQHRATFLDRTSLRVVWIVTEAGRVLDELADDARPDLDVVLDERELTAGPLQTWHLTRSDEGQTVLVVDLVVV